MSVYSTRPGLQGSLIFTKDRLAIKKEKVPANIVARLIDGEMDIDEASVKLEGPARFCLFCKKLCKATRFVNGQTVYLCEEHYHSKNIGQIAQQLREGG